MKKVLFTTLLLLGLKANAQVELGAKIGALANVITGKTEEGESFTPMPGGNIGIYAKFAANEFYGIKTEALFSLKGGTNKFNGKTYQVASVVDTIDGIPVTVPQPVIANTDYKVTNWNAYVEVPLLMYYNVSDELTIEAGPSLSFLMLSKGKGYLNWKSDEYGASSESEIKNNYKKDEAAQPGAYAAFLEKKGNYFTTLDIGFNLGAEYALNDKFFVGGRFQYGLHDITNNFYDRSKVDYTINDLNQQAKGVNRGDVDRNINLSIYFGVRLYNSSDY